MKIVHCLFTMETGGAQVLAIDLLNQLCASHEVYLIIVNDEWNRSLLTQLDKRVAVHLIKRKTGSRNPMPLIKLNMLLLKLKPDVIHCHEGGMGQIIKMQSGKLLYTIHDVGIPVSFYHHYSTLVAISDAVYKDVIAKYPHNLKKIYNGIVTGLFSHRKGHSIQSHEHIRFVQVSRLMHEKKGQDILLRALKMLYDDHGFTNFSMDFVGSGASHGYLLELVNELGLKDQVNFLGEKDRSWLFGNLCTYNILVQPSRYEGFGLTLLEGFAAGLLVVASDIEGPAEIVRNIPGGFLFKNGNVEDCAKQLHFVVKQYSGNKLNDLAGKSVPAVNDKYSIEACTKGYLHEYTTLAASGAS